MKKHNIAFVLWCIVFWSITFAQESKQTPQTPIPASLSQNCLLTQSGGIDFCPAYRDQIRDMNLKLSQQRSQSESEWIITLLDTIRAKLKNLNSQSNVLLMNALSGYPLFSAEYEKYITTLFSVYIKENSDSRDVVGWFFKTTYFDQDQWGLWISAVKVYKWTPRQYDTSLLLQVSIRNYTPNPLANIEDLYCFATINNQDYIYPMGITTSFKENTITNLIVELKTNTTPLLEQLWEKDIACTLVYSQVGQTKYTNRGKFSFLMKQE